MKSSEKLIHRSTSINWRKIRNEEGQSDFQCVRRKREKSAETGGGQLQLQLQLAAVKDAAFECSFGYKSWIQMLQSRRMLRTNAAVVTNAAFKCCCSDKRII